LTSFPVFCYDKSQEKEIYMQYVVPMYESERGWGAKIDGYAGPFESHEEALAFQRAYNLKNNNEKITPDWYIRALEPTTYNGHKCDYKTTV